ARPVRGDGREPPQAAPRTLSHDEPDHQGARDRSRAGRADPAGGGGGEGARHRGRRHEAPPRPGRSRRGLAAAPRPAPPPSPPAAQVPAPLAAVQRVLAAHDPWLPIDPPYGDATIGGVLATASSGPRRLGHGTIKDALLGLRVLGPGGQATKSGGRVVKNVSGY